MNTLLINLVGNNVNSPHQRNVSSPTKYASSKYLDQPTKDTVSFGAVIRNKDVAKITAEALDQFAKLVETPKSEQITEFLSGLGEGTRNGVISGLESKHFQDVEITKGVLNSLDNTNPIIEIIVNKQELLFTKVEELFDITFNKVKETSFFPNLVSKKIHWGEVSFTDAPLVTDKVLKETLDILSSKQQYQVINSLLTRTAIEKANDLNRVEIMIDAALKQPEGFNALSDIINPHKNGNIILNSSPEKANLILKKVEEARPEALRPALNEILKNNARQFNLTHPQLKRFLEAAKIDYVKAPATDKLNTPFYQLFTDGTFRNSVNDCKKDKQDELFNIYLDKIKGLPELAHDFISPNAMYNSLIAHNVPRLETTLEAFPELTAKFVKSKDFPNLLEINNERVLNNILDITDSATIDNMLKCKPCSRIPRIPSHFSESTVDNLVNRIERLSTETPDFSVSDSNDLLCSVIYSDNPHTERYKELFKQYRNSL